MIAPADDDDAAAAATWCRPAGRCRCPTTGRWPGWRSASCPPARVRRWLNEGEFDVLHVHEPAAPSLSLLACWVGDRADRGHLPHREPALPG